MTKAEAQATQQARVVYWLARWSDETVTRVVRAGRHVLRQRARIRAKNRRTGGRWVWVPLPPKDRRA